MIDFTLEELDELSDALQDQKVRYGQIYHSCKTESNKQEYYNSLLILNKALEKIHKEIRVAQIRRAKETFCKGCKHISDNGCAINDGSVISNCSQKEVKND